jgi:hypothetical protein
VTDAFALQARVLDPSRARLAALELQLAEREGALASVTGDLQRLQSRYLEAVAALYRELVALDSAIVAAEIRVGLRPPPDEADISEPKGDAEAGEAAGCSNHASPSKDLKKIFRHLAKSIHPDLALDEPARWRRHSLMAEANRAYAERDEDRLRLILHAWERSSDTYVPDPSPDEERVRRRTAAIEDRLVAITSEFDDLHASAIWQLKEKIDDARRQGWDLFAEMVAEVTREVGRAKARLASLERMTAGLSERAGGQPG